MINLSLYKKYYIKIFNTYNYFTVENEEDGYFLNFLENSNNYLFTLSKIYSHDFIKKILGYNLGGVFPYCKTIEDLTKLLFELLKEMENRGFIFTCNFEYKDSNFISYWND